MSFNVPTKRATLILTTVLGKATGDLWMARAVCREVELMKKNGEVNENEPWSLSHGFFGFMGGFRYIEDGDHPADDHPQALLSRSWILLPHALLELRRKKHIAKLPSITEAEIHDRSKANAFVKTLTVIQVTWVCAQVIVRTSRGLVVSQLELVTAAFAVCAVITYMMLISKPHGVQVPLAPITVAKGAIGETDDLFPLRILLIPGLSDEKIMGSSHNDNQLGDLPNDCTLGEKDDKKPYIVGIIVGGLIFGAVHMAGWNFGFPTPIEQLLWRISSVIITCLLPLVLLPYSSLVYEIGFVEDLDPEEIHMQIWSAFFGLVYVLARLYLLVETFRTLAFLPPDAFVSTWVQNIPYIG
jgi:hypothetical protein